ncbi:hypothetical protein ABIC50_001021 [Burkholderia sp. 567]
MRDCKRTARRYATTRATATAGVTATSAASRAQSAQPPLAQLPHGGALAIASAICSGVRSR